jgi:hypothetical protein
MMVDYLIATQQWLLNLIFLRFETGGGVDKYSFPDLNAIDLLIKMTIGKVWR